MSDETFLESFIGESLATLPHEMRRSMELIKDLDQRGDRNWSRLLELQHQFLQQAEEAVLSKLQVVELMPDEEDEEEGVDVEEDNSKNSSAKRKKGSHQQQGVLERKQSPKKKYGVLVLKSDGTSFDPDHYNPDTDAVIPTTDELFQLILTSQQDNAMSSNKTKKDSSASATSSNITTYNEIRRLQQACRQTAEEKVAVARQAWERLDAQVQRLDADLLALETQLAQQHGPDWAAALLLGGFANNGPSSNNNSNINTSTSHSNAGAINSSGKPNDLVACQVTPGSEWILAKIILHDPNTGNYKLADEDSESHKSTYLIVWRCNCLLN